MASDRDDGRQRSGDRVAVGVDLPDLPAQILRDLPVVGAGVGHPLLPADEPRGQAGTGPHPSVVTYRAPPAGRGPALACGVASPRAARISWSKSFTPATRARASRTETGPTWRDLPFMAAWALP